MNVTLIRRPAEQVQLLEDLEDSHHPRRVLREAPTKFRSDHEVVSTAVVRDASCIGLADETLRKSRDFALNLAKQNGMVLKFCPELQDDPEVCMAAVRQDGFALQYVSDALRKSKPLVLAAVSRDGLALEFAAAELQRDKEVVLAAVEQDASSMDFVADCLKADHDFLLFAVSVNGRVLERLAEDLQRNEEIVLAAVQEGTCVKKTTRHRYGSKATIGISKSNNYRGPAEVATIFRLRAVLLGEVQTRTVITILGLLAVLLCLRSAVLCCHRASGCYNGNLGLPLWGSRAGWGSSFFFCNGNCKGGRLEQRFKGKKAACYDFRCEKASQNLCFQDLR